MEIPLSRVGYTQVAAFGAFSKTGGRRSSYAPFGHIDSRVQPQPCQRWRVEMCIFEWCEVVREYIRKNMLAVPQRLRHSSQSQEPHQGCVTATTLGLAAPQTLRQVKTTVKAQKPRQGYDVRISRTPNPAPAQDSSQSPRHGQGATSGPGAAGAMSG